MSGQPENNGTVTIAPGTDNQIAETQRFLLALFDQYDKVLIRPTETWNETVERKGKAVQIRRSRIIWRHSKHLRALILTQSPDDRQRLLAVSEREKANLFFGVCPRPASTRRGTYDLAWQVRVVRSLWADLDHCDVEEALERCRKAGLPRPSLVVRSGHGVHLYWLLSEPVRIDDAEEVPPVCFWRMVKGKNDKMRKVYYIERKDGTEDDPPDLSPKAKHVQNILAGIASKINGDHTQDLARLLRLPGTMNRKDERNGAEPVPCTLAECDPDRRYTFTEFEKFAEASPQQQAEKTVKLKTGFKLTARREKQLADMLHDCEHAEDRSEADFAALAWAIERGICKSEVWSKCEGVGKFKERGEDYFNRTWAKCEDKVKLKFYLRAQTTYGKPTNGHTTGETTPPEATSQPQPEIVHDPEREGQCHDLLKPHLTDRGNAIRQVNLHGHELRYCWPWKTWLVWDSKRWRLDDTGLPTTWAKDVIAELYNLAIAEIQALKEEMKSDPENEEKNARLNAIKKILGWALKSEGAPRLNAMVELTRSERGIPILHEQLDANPWLLNCPNGTIDLRTGQLLHHNQEHFLTKLCPVEYHPDAACPVWLNFLNDIFQGDADLITFQQRFAGYALTGDVREDVLPIAWGKGSNGKTTFFGTLLGVMGSDYAMRANPTLLMQGRNEHPTELAQLFGMRLVIASETEEDAKLKESQVKDLTGRERIRARRMKENFWEFDPTHKIVLQTNHKPKISGTDDGIWRRLRLVPFSARFWKLDEAGIPDQVPEELIADVRLSEKLKAEYPGILAWMVGGCLDWQRGGLTLPEKIKVATTQYRRDEDVIASWLQECCVTGRAYKDRATPLYDCFTAWCERNGEKVLTQNMFGRRMGDRFQKLESNGVWYESVARSQDHQGEPDSPDWQG
jgi:P4 family phage/plasmid primase-like protien